MDEFKLSLTTRHRKERLRRLRTKRAVIQLAILVVFLAIYLGLRLGARTYVSWFAGSRLWKHTLAGHARTEFFVCGCLLEMLGIWGFTLDTKPYYFFSQKGIEPLWGFASRTRQFVLDIGCVVVGALCIWHALAQ